MMEILVAMSISIILIMICLPILKNIYEQHNETILQKQLTNAIIQARRTASVLQMPIGLCESNDGKVCQDGGQKVLLIFIDDQQGVIHNENQMIAIIQLINYPGKLKIRSFPYYRNYLVFSPMVLSNSDNGSLWYCRIHESNPAWAISFNKLGQLRVIDEQTFTNNHLPYPCP